MSGTEVSRDEDEPPLWWKIKFYIFFVCFVLATYISIKIPMVYQQRNLEEWEAFRVSNNCKIVEKVAPTFNTGVGIGLRGGGMMIGGFSTPEQTTWKCDDGATYTR